MIFLNCKESAKKETNQQSVDVIEKSWINLSNDNFDGWHIFQNEDGKKVVGHQKMVYIPLIKIMQKVKETKAF